MFNRLYFFILYAITYAPLTAVYIDVVIPCHTKDLSTLPLVITGIKKNVKDVRRIIIVSAKQLTHHAEWFDEKLYPFTKKDIAYEIFQDKKNASRFLHAKNTKIGWIYQQLLKLYAPFVIPNISTNVLIVDADTVFLRPIECISNDIALYATGDEYHEPYFNHAKRLIPGFSRAYDTYSGITNHQLFQKHILCDLFTIVEQAHSIPFWKAFCRCIDHKEVFGASASEYEIYFNFAFSRNYAVKIRSLRWGIVNKISALKKPKSKNILIF